MRRDAEAARRSRQALRRQREHRADWMTRFTHVTPAHVTDTFTTADFDSAERSLANAAADHDQNSVHARAIREVQGDGTVTVGTLFAAEKAGQVNTTAAPYAQP